MAPVGVAQWTSPLEQLPLVLKPLLLDADHQVNLGSEKESYTRVRWLVFSARFTTMASCQRLQSLTHSFPLLPMG